jgi:hypothetical protein
MERYNLIFEKSFDHIQAYLDIKTKIIDYIDYLHLILRGTKKKYISILKKMASSVPELSSWIKGDRPALFYYEHGIKSLVRPPFSTSVIYTSPPENTKFQEGYEVQRPGGRVMSITIYELTDRPESLYFHKPIPCVRMNLRLLRLRKKLKHKPKTLISLIHKFKEYFRRLGKRCSQSHEKY